MLDVFSANPAFTITGLTATLEAIPIVPYQIGQLGLFTEEFLTTTTAQIEVRGDRLALVPALPRGAPPTPNVEDRRSLVAFVIPHFPIRDNVFADAVQNVRAFGSTDRLEAVQSVVDRRQVSMSRKLDVTLEYLRLGAVKGVIIIAADRVTGAPLETVDLFRQFDVDPQPPLDWPILGAGRIAQEAAAWEAQLTGLVNQLSRAMADEVPMMTGVHGVCGSEFYDAVATHPERRAAFIAISSAVVTDARLGTRIQFRDMTLEEYKGKIGDRRFVAPDECHFFPLGVPDLFLEVYAPGDYMEAVNTLALRRYSKMEDMEFDKGAMLEMQMNVLPICTLPRALFTARVTDYVPPEATAAAGHGGEGGEGAEGESAEGAEGRSARRNAHGQFARPAR